MFLSDNFEDDQDLVVEEEEVIVIDLHPIVDPAEMTLDRGISEKDVASCAARKAIWKWIVLTTEEDPDVAQGQDLETGETTEEGIILEAFLLQEAEEEITEEVIVLAADQVVTREAIAVATLSTTTVQEVTTPTRNLITANPPPTTKVHGTTD